MEIVLSNEEKIKLPTAVAIGNFDGIHLGHQCLVNEMTKLAIKYDLKSTVLTFNNHTTEVTKNDKLPHVIMSQNQRIEIFREMKVALVYMLTFNKAIMNLKPIDFIEKILLSQLNAQLVVIGFNFKFGYKAEGDAEYLKEMGKKLGFKVVVVPPIYYNNKIVSSTYIRTLVKNGEVNLAKELLGQPYTINGRVTTGKGRGKGLGVPTANIETVTGYVIPKHGVYKTITTLDNKKYHSITNVGMNPTFDEINVSIETHILDFEENIYDKNISISFIEFMRGEIKFSNSVELIQQMKKDIEYVKKNG